MFLFVKARIATDDEGVLPFPRDLHKISILEASREKYRRVTRAHDESLLLKPALLALTYAEITKEKSLFSRIGPISRLHPAFPPLVSSPRPPSCILDPPASSRSQSHLRLRNLFDPLSPRSLNPHLNVLLLLVTRRSRNRSVSFALSLVTLF